MSNVGGFIIHLKRATARLPQVEQLCQQLPIAGSIVTAVDGTGLTELEQSQYKRHLMRPFYPFPLRDTEIATFLSHRACWQAIVDQGLDAALILEDDVTLDEPAFAEAFKAALAHMGQGDFVRFPVKSRERQGKTLSSGTDPRVLMPRSIGLGMQAQLVTREAAQTLLEKTQQFDRPVDTYLQMRWDHGVRVLTISPSGIGEISGKLGGSMIGKRKGFWERIYREVFRPLYRLRFSVRQRMKEAKG